MYLENPDGITWRVKKVLTLALSEFGTEGEAARKGLHALPNAEKAGGKAGNADTDGTQGTARPTVSEDVARKRGEAYIAQLPDGEKRWRMAAVFAEYMSGKKLCDVATSLGVSKGSVSGYLNEIEKAVGCRVVRGGADPGSLRARLKANDAKLWTVREDGKRRASLRDFHSFRVTWVTLALTAGVPLELVQKVTGHKTTDIVLKHYFQPGREAFRQALQSAMPKLLTNGQRSPKEEMREILEAMTAKTWKRDRLKLMELLKR
jgi:hypothetical protein